METILCDSPCISLHWHGILEMFNHACFFTSLGRRSHTHLDAWVCGRWETPNLVPWSPTPCLLSVIFLKPTFGLLPFLEPSSWLLINHTVKSRLLWLAASHTFSCVLVFYGCVTSYHGLSNVKRLIFMISVFLCVGSLGGCDLACLGSLPQSLNQAAIKISATASVSSDAQLGKNSLLCLLC